MKDVLLICLYAAVVWVFASSPDRSLLWAKETDHERTPLPYFDDEDEMPSLAD